MVRGLRVCRHSVAQTLVEVPCGCTLLATTEAQYTVNAISFAEEAVALGIRQIVETKLEIPVDKAKMNDKVGRYRANEKMIKHFM